MIQLYIIIIQNILLYYISIITSKYIMYIKKTLDIISKNFKSLNNKINTIYEKRLNLLVETILEDEI